MNTKKIKFALVAILILSVSFAGTIRSQGTAGATQLLIPTGAQSIALSTANGATVSGVESIFINPAGAANMGSGFQGSASNMSYLADIAVTNIGFLSNIGSLGTVGLNIKSLDFGDIAVTDADNTEGTGEFFSPAFMTLTANFSKRMTDRVNFGVNFKIISEKIMNTGASGFGVDFGVQYGFENLPLSIGVALKNLGGKMEYTGSDLEQQLTPEGSESGTIKERFRIKAQEFDLPATLDLSANYSIGSTIDLMANYRNNSFAVNALNVAARYKFGDLAWVGAGTSMDMVADDQPDDVSDDAWDEWTSTVWGSTFGAGVSVPLGTMTLNIDYSIRTVSNYFDNNNVLQLSVEF